MKFEMKYVLTNEEESELNNVYSTFLYNLRITCCIRLNV